MARAKLGCPFPEVTMKRNIMVIKNGNLKPSQEGNTSKENIDKNIVQKFVDLNEDQILLNINSSKEKVKSALNGTCDIYFTIGKKKININSISIANIFKLMIGQ